jgi:homocysteine S-methyltransferase
MTTLRELISDGHTHLFDGAMGTMLYARGVFLNVCYDELSLKQPDLIRDIHREYVRAGAEILETNTFGANPIKLAHHGLAAETEKINEAAARLAREAAGSRVAVVGAIGPLGIRIEPFGETSVAEAREAFGRQVDGLLAGEVDGFVLETFSDIEELRAAFEAVRSRSDLPIVAQMTVGTDGKTYYGTEPASFGPALQAMGADVVGVNCSVGPHGVLEVVEQLAKVVTAPISALPNAGLPREVGDRKMYMASPEYMAEYARRIVEAGARFVGGCCGTTPDHIKAMVGFVKSVAPRHAAAFAAKPAAAPTLEPPPLAERSHFGAKLARGEFITTVEIVPPKGVDPAPMFDQVRELKAAGVDAVNVPDGPRAQSRMGALLSGLLIQREMGMEAVVHYACRDRNLLGMLSDLLGAAASGLRNLLIVTGDPPKMGPYPDATAVFDIDSIGLTNLVSRLNHGLDPGGNSLGGGSTTKFVIGVGVNPAAVDPDRELKRFAWKVEAGAEYAITQPVFDLDQLDRFLKRVESLRIPIIAGLWPLVSLRNAEFLANEVPGVTVPQAILDRMRAASAKGKDQALEEGIGIAREMSAAVRQRVRGIQVAAPLGRAGVAVRVIG